MFILAPLICNPGEVPLPQGALWIENSEIKYVGSKKTAPSEAKKDANILFLEDTYLFPGLVNAHCHLELTLPDPLPYPGSFTSWIQKILQIKTAISPERKQEFIQTGLKLSLQGGATTLADHMSFDTPLEPLLKSPCRTKGFIEVLGLVEEVAENILNTNEAIAQTHRLNPKLHLIPSPHSIHAVHPQVLKKMARKKSSALSIHLLESKAEWDYFHTEQGELMEFIQSRGVTPDLVFKNPITYLEAMGFDHHQILAIHMNYGSEDDFRRLSQMKASVVHCPLSHQYFGHHPFPMEQIKKYSMNLALGTDSLASSTSLSMLDVLRATESAFPQLSKEELFYMATLGGAKALGWENLIGSLTQGKKADFIGIKAKSGQNPLELLFEASHINFSMIDGIIIWKEF